MENASKALLMAGGILIGILILSLMTTLFVSSKQLSTTYDKTKNEEAIQRFNVNFTKYLGHDLTIHQVVTMENFANIKNNKICDVTITNIGNTIESDMQQINAKYESDYANRKVKLEIVYRITKIHYNDVTGYVSQVDIGAGRLKITEYDEYGKVISISYS